MARACGKVIMLGEHAVVYGAPALAVGLDRGVTAEARPAPVATLRIDERSATAGDGSELSRGLEALLTSVGAPPLAVTARLELPPGSGLGASAALGVAMARAALAVCRPELDLSSDAGRKLVLAAADAWERVFHGNPSGIDATAAERGGCLRYSRAEGASPVRVARELRLAIAVAGPPASTRAMVESVARLFERRPEIKEKSLSGITALVENARLCIEAGDLPGLGKLMDLNQMLLAGLMLSTEDIERACDAARRAGALGAKLTGAGGGGAVVALADLDPEPVLAAFRSEGFSCFAATVAADPEPVLTAPGVVR
jgi:mevalonate kinase